MRELRKERGLTQRQLSVFLECTQSMITRWEKNECEPTESIIRKTAIFFNVTSDYLLGLEDETGSKVNQKINIGNNNQINGSFNNM